MFNAANILEALKNYIHTHGGTSNAYNIAEAVNDLNSIPQGSGGGIPEAPIDNKQYARKNGDWSEVESSGSDIPDEVTNAIETHGMGWTSEEEVEGFDIQWDGNTEGLESLLDGTLFKVDPNLHGITSAEDLIGSTIFDITDGQETRFDITEEDVEVVVDGLLSAFGSMVVVALSDVTVSFGEDIRFSKGIWFPGGDEENHTSHLYKETSVKEVPHPINIKYIPEESGCKVFTMEAAESGLVSNLTPSEVVSIMKTKPVIGVMKMGSFLSPLGVPYFTSTEGSDVVIFYVVSPRSEFNYGLVPFIKGDVSTDTWTIVG